MKMEPTSISLPPELMRSVKAMAKRHGVSQSALIREALTQFVIEDEGKPSESESLGTMSSGEIQSERYEERLAENRKRDR